MIASRTTLESAFVAAVAAFRRWAGEAPAAGRSGEWEADYEDWPSLTRAYCDVLDGGDPGSWDGDLMDLLLYALARDNEAEVLKDELVLRPAHLVALAKAAPLSGEADARWQIADALGDLEATQDMEALLEPFLRDADEYVSRRALLALTRRGSAQLDAWAVRAWETGHEYQRMAALEAFSTNNSPLLSSHLDLAETDGRPHLARLAKDLRARRA